MKSLNQIRIGKLFLLLIFSFNIYGQNTIQGLYDHYEKIWSKQNPNSTNLDAKLTWENGYVMNSLIDMYITSGNIEYINKAINHFEHALSQRDDLFGRNDLFGEANPTWVSTKYTNGKPYPYLVHSGIITYPMLRFSLLVEQNENLKKIIYREKSSSYNNKCFEEIVGFLVSEVRKTVEHHNLQWDEAIGAYRFRSGAYFTTDNVVLPFNQQNAMGRSLLILYNLTGEIEYKKKATGLAKWLKKHLKLDEATDSYTWPYKISDPLAEDISHAAINIGFAYLCYQNDLVFDAKDINRFINTFLYNICEDNKIFNERVDGSGETNRYIDQVGRWLILSMENKEIVDKVSELYLSKNATPQNGHWVNGSYLYIISLLSYHLDKVVPANEVLIYPNPSNTFFNVHVGDINHDQILFNLIDGFGNTISSNILSNGETNCSFSVDYLSNGVYFLKTTIDRELIGTNKIIIKN